MDQLEERNNARANGPIILLGCGALVLIVAAASCFLSAWPVLQ